MLLKSNRAIFASFFFAALLSSCGGPNDYHINEKETVVPVIPHISIDVKAPNEILYVQNDMQMSLKSIPFLKNSLKFIEQGTALFSATGDGGLGVDLDSENNLDWYEGIPVSLTWNNVNQNSKQVLISSSGDGPCAHIFHFDQEKSLIRIDYAEIDTLLVCDVKVTAIASFNSESTHDEKTFRVALNPTMSFYADNDDRTYRYLKSYTSLSDSTMIARWLKDRNAQASGLKLRYDSTIITDKISPTNMNALTGAQSITSIDLSNTDLRDIRALAYLKNLQNIDLSYTKFETKDVTILKDLPSLNSLKIRGIHLKNLKNVTDNLRNLTALDISGNDEIRDLEDIQNLKNLRVLKASHMGLKDLNKFSHMTQITDLDISQNDLSQVDVGDVQTLVNLYNLKGLNVSQTHISDEFLNSYFDMISNRNTLEKFVDANYFDRDTAITKEDCRSRINIFDNIQHISEIKSLEYIDLHGNGCKAIDENTGESSEIGLTRTIFFSKMSNLQYLDISNTPVKDLSDISQSNSLQILHLVHHPADDEISYIDEGGISMTAQACAKYFTNSSPLAAECDKLGHGKLENQEFTSSGKQTFVVPFNVFKIHVMGCSAGDGGQGGQGSTGTNRIFVDNNNPGRDPGQPSCRRGGCLKSASHFVDVPAEPGVVGGLGGKGGLTILSSLDKNMFSTTKESYYTPHNHNCGGGLGGGSGDLQGNSGANKQTTEADFDVTPGQTLNIFIPIGGAGGSGGQGSGGGCAPAGGCGTPGQNGPTGFSGTPGYLKISWSSI